MLGNRFIAAGCCALLLAGFGLSGNLRGQEAAVERDSVANAADQGAQVTRAADSLSGDPLHEIRALLDQARKSHEPTLVIKQAVGLLDEELDRNPGNRDAWMKLGEALAIGHALSLHAVSFVDAWRRAYELDPTDCHAGALAARFSDHPDGQTRIRELAELHPECAEALYLRAFAPDSSSGDDARLELLQKSIAIRPSAEAAIALGQEFAQRRRWQEAERALSAALAAPPLFPEDWRPDGWTAVHAYLGLAWVRFSRDGMKESRRDYAAFMRWFAVPGPWHDLNDTEEIWRMNLEARWPEITGKTDAK